MVIERIRDKLDGSNDPHMVVERSTCPMCGYDTYVSEFEETEEGRLVLDNLYCERCGDY